MLFPKPRSKSRSSSSVSDFAEFELCPMQPQELLNWRFWSPDGMLLSGYIVKGALNIKIFLLPGHFDVFMPVDDW